MGYTQANLCYTYVRLLGINIWPKFKSYRQLKTDLNDTKKISNGRHKKLYCMCIILYFIIKVIMARFIRK